MLTAMARELVTENGVGESAHVIWRQIEAEHGKIAPFVMSEPEVAPVVEDPLRIPSAASMLVAVNAPKFGSRPPMARPVRRRDDPPLDVQFSLF